MQTFTAWARSNTTRAIARCGLCCTGARLWYIQAGSLVSLLTADELGWADPPIRNQPGGGFLRAGGLLLHQVLWQAQASDRAEILTLHDRAGDHQRGVWQHLPSEQRGGAAQPHRDLDVRHPGHRRLVHLRCGAGSVQPNFISLAGAHSLSMQCRPDLAQRARRKQSMSGPLLGALCMHAMPYCVLRTHTVQCFTLKSPFIRTSCLA